VQGNRPLATKGDPSFGGADVDQALLEHVGTAVSGTDEQAWRELVEGRELADRRRRRVVHQDVRGAKESLSRHAYTDVPMPSPFADAHVTRDDLERLISARIDRAAELTAATIRAAGLKPADLAGIFLVGGSSRIPLVSQLVHRRCGVVPTTLDQPETVVARGALRAVAGLGEGTGALHTVRQPQVRRPVPPPRVVPPPRPGAVLRPTPPVSNTKRRSALLLVAAATLVAAVVTVIVVLLNGGEPARGRASASTTPAPTGRLIAQYEYQFTLPESWRQTGGDPNTLRTEVKPGDALGGDNLVLVQQVRLSFDSTADRSRAVGKLRDEFDKAGDAFSGFEDDATFAGRHVVHYQQSLPNKDATVDWYVVFHRTTQVSVGCQRENAGGRGTEVSAACEMIVRTLRITE
jgi:molecular chaperone DnaK